MIDRIIQATVSFIFAAMMGFLLSSLYDMPNWGQGAFTILFALHLITHVKVDKK